MYIDDPVRLHHIIDGAKKAVSSSLHTLRVLCVLCGKKNLCCLF